ncbi:MAG: protein kinase [Pirellulaceae bacterium]
MKRSIPHQSTRASVSTGSTHRGSSVDRFREKSLVLDAAMLEYMRCREEGKSIDVAEFCEKYPKYRNSLRRLIDVHERLPAFEMLSEEKWPEVGEVFAGYDIKELLGAGSMARVYLASELQLGGRSVAIKVSKQGSYEAETLGKLAHPNIVQVYSVAYDEDSDLTVVCMPYQGSATLSDVLDVAYEVGPPPTRAQVILDVAQQMALPGYLPHAEPGKAEVPSVLERGSFVAGVVHLGLQLADALKYAHERGVLHRDLKPSNVLLTPSGRPMVLDFNLSFDADLNVVHHGGTLPYAAPEQLSEAAAEVQPRESLVNERADVFGLGCILYQLLTGKLPFGTPAGTLGPRQAIQAQLDAQTVPPLHPSLLNPDVDASLQAIILRCLACDPDQRYADMGELGWALRRYVRPAHRLGRWAQRHRTVLTVSLAGVAIASGLIYGYWSRLPPYEQRVRVQAEQLIAAGDLTGAFRVLDDLLAQRPDDRASWILRGNGLQRQGNLVEAAAAYRRATDLGAGADVDLLVSQTLRSLIGQAAALLEAGNISGASQRIREVESIEPDNNAARFLQGIVYQRSGDHAHAIELLEPLKEALRDQPEFLDYLAHSYFHARSPRQACILYAPKKGLSYDIALRHAFCQLDWQGNLTGLSLLDSLIERDPNRFEAYLLRAHLRFRYRRKDDEGLKHAIQDLRLAAARAPESQLVRYQAALILAAGSRDSSEIKLEVQEHLLAAVRLGLSRQAFDDMALWEPVAQEPWFPAIVERSAANSQPLLPQRHAIAELFLPAPRSISTALLNRLLDPSRLPEEQFTLPH